MILGTNGMPIAGSANASVGGMMRNVGARSAAMFGEGKPYDEELEYLESNGNQYIDTGIKGDSRDGRLLFITAAYVGQNEVGCLFGSVDGRGFYQLNKTVYANEFRLITQSGDVFFTKDYEFYSKFHTYNVIGNILYIDNQFIIQGLGEKSLRSVNTFLFCRNQNNSANQFGKWRIKSETVDNEGVLLQSLIPVLKDCIPCMYDRVSGGFYYNQVAGHQFGYKKKDGTIVDPT